MNPQDQNDTNRARQGEGKGRMRNVLIISLGAAIIGMGLAWIFII